MESRGLSLMTALSVFGASVAFAQTDSFDKDRPGAVPSGWECGITGKGKTFKAKLKKCQNKDITYTFVMTREDNSVLRFDAVTGAITVPAACRTWSRACSPAWKRCKASTRQTLPKRLLGGVSKTM